MQKEGIVGEPWARLRWFESCVALSGGVAFAAVGPLRGAFATLPGVLLVSTFILFMAPGVLLTRWLLDDYFSGAAALPAAFVISAGTLALLGVPMLLLQSTLEAYLWASGTAIAASLLAAALVALRPGKTPKREIGTAAFARGGPLWLPFLALVAVSAYISRINAPSHGGDIWIYLSWVRGFLGGDPLASHDPYFGDQVGLSRVRISGWLLEQAAFSRVSGVDPVDLVFSYLNPALVVVALLAFYALARTLLGSEKAALFCGSLYALFLLVHLDVSRVTFGGEFIQRLPEDKLATKFLFLPLALAFAAAFLEGGRRVYFWCFAFACCAVVAVHPVGLAIIGVSMAGFGTLHLAANPRAREAWGRISAMGLAGLVVIAVPAILILATTGKPLTAVFANSDINSGDPDVLRNMIFVNPARQRIFEFADGSYMMHPSLVLNPVILTAFVLGIPFLLWRVRGSLAAQLLLGVLVFTTVICYVPPISTFLGDDLVLPGQLWRLAWPIPLAALLTLGWLAWEVSSRAAGRLEGLRVARPLARALPLLLVVALAVAAAPRVKAGLELVERHKEVARAQGFYPADPIYLWFRDEITSPSVVLASDRYSARIPSYSSEANVVSRRGNLVLRVLPKLEKRAAGKIEVPQGSLDVREFFNGTDLETAIGILRRHKVKFVMVESDSELNKAMAGLPGFESVRVPSERFDLYRVDLPTLERQLDTEGNVRLPPQ
jgi:Family of unknown function (DUF6077)